MTGKKFITVINCIDGRVQLPVIEWARRKHRTDYVDMITEPGPNKILAENKDIFLVDSIKRRVEISVKKHGSRLIVIAGHYDCAGNPEGKETQFKQLISAIKTVESWGFKTAIAGLWINERWEVFEIG